jgi:uncharacterized protein (TIGR02145 family)
MKKYIIIAFAGVIVSLTACKPEDKPEPPSLEIKFTGAIVQPSAPGSIGSPWTTDHHIGVYVGRANIMDRRPNPPVMESLPILSAEKRLVENKQFSASPGSLTTFSAVGGTPLLFEHDDDYRVRFIAYRPFSNVITEDFKKPINLSNQNNLAALEVLYARTTKEETGYNWRHQEPVHLDFTHQLTKLVFHISNGEGVTEPVANGVSVKITNQNITGYMQLEDGSLETTGDPTNITVSSSGSGSTVTAQAIVFPGSTEDVKLEITNNGGQTFIITVPHAEWNGSYIYNYNIMLSTTGATTGSSISGSIRPWLDGGNTNLTGTGDPVTFVLDLANVNWDEAYIYEIFVGSVKVGELCREFLHNSSVRRQTVTAYTMLSNSDKVDLAKGLVVDNGYFIEWNTSVTAGTFSLLTNPILTSYVAGETVVGTPTVIYLPEGNSRWTTINPNTTGNINVTLKPLLLVDERRGPASPHDEDESEHEIEIYRIVKIGTQYWIADNFRTRRFVDGMPILTDVDNNSWNVRNPFAAADTSLAWAPATALSAMRNNAAAVTTNNAYSTMPGDVDIRNTYGVLYNFSAVINFRPAGHATAIPPAEFIDRLSPEGWSIPKREQFELLYRYVHQLDGAIANRPASPLSAFRTNETGFSARGGRQRSGTGTYTSDQTHFMMIDTYVHNPAGHATNFETWHTMTTFRVNLADAPTTNSAHFPANQSVATANYIRLIRN